MSRQSERGAALLTVLGVVSILTVITSLVFQQTFREIGTWAKERHRLQALYLAESGVAHQLYLERISDEDSSDTDSLSDFDLDPLLSEASGEDLAFHFDSSLELPTVTSEAGAYLRITSTGVHRGASVTINASFGLALNEEWFGSALTLLGDGEFQEVGLDNIVGSVRMKNIPAVFTGHVESPPSSVNIGDLVSELVDVAKEREATLLSILSGEEGMSHEETYTPQAPPIFEPGDDIYFPHTGVKFDNGYEEEPFVITGPVRFFAKGRIEVSGRVHLKDVELYSESEIVLQDSVTSDGLVLFSQTRINLHKGVDVTAEIMAAEGLTLEGTAMTGLGSLLLMGFGDGGGANKLVTGAIDTSKVRVNDTTTTTNSADTNEITLEINDQAKAAGFVVTGGKSSNLAIAPEATLEGFAIVSGEAWIEGEVHGGVITESLRCDENDPRYCLGDGRIDHSKLPEELTQPLELLPDSLESPYKILDWRVVHE